MVGRKAQFIEQAFIGDETVRTLEDISEASQYEMAAALAAGDERAIQLAGLNADVEKLNRLARAFGDEQRHLRQRKRDLERNIEKLAQKIEVLESLSDLVKIPDGQDEGFHTKIGKHTYDKRTEAGEALKNKIDKVLVDWTPSGAKAKERISVGTVNDTVHIVAELDVGETANEQRIGKRVRGINIRVGTKYEEQIFDSRPKMLNTHAIESAEFSGSGLITRVINRIRSFEREAAEGKANIKAMEQEVSSLGKRIGIEFPQGQELAEKTAQAAQLKAELSKEDVDGGEGMPGDGLASLRAGEYLPESKGRRGIPLKRAQKVVDAFLKRAKNATDAEVVQSFKDLPGHIKKTFAGKEAAIEGVYDPATHKVWIIADNIADTARVAEVLLHEQVGHHGLRSLIPDTGERGRILSKLFVNTGGMSNPLIKEIADKYKLDPRQKQDDRLRVMEEVIARMAEKRNTDGINTKEAGVWQKIVSALLRVWNGLVQQVTGHDASMQYDNMDRLLAALGKHVLDGETTPKRTPAAQFYPDTGSRNDFVTLPDGTIDFGNFPSTRLNDMRLLRAAPMRLQRGTHTLSGGEGLRHIEANHGVEIKAAGYASVQEFVWDLVNGFNEIWEGKGRSFLLLKNNNSDSRLAGFIELEKNGSFYIIKNAYPVDKSYPTAATRKLLWKSAPPSSPTSGEQAPSNPFTPGIPYNNQTGNLQGQRGQSGFEDNITPVEHDDKTPLASLSLNDILNMGTKKAHKIAQAPEMKDFFKQEDLKTWQRAFALPHWIAKQYPAFTAVYDRQLRRMDERASLLAKSLESVPSLFGQKTLGKKDMESLKNILWEYEGAEVESLEKVEKFMDVNKLANGRSEISVNPKFYEAYEDWLGTLDGTDRAKQAMLEIRKSLDTDLVKAHNRMASMSELGDDVIKEYRQSIRAVPNYFPHHRYGDYYVQAIIDDEVVFRQHFDAKNIAEAKKKAAILAADLKHHYPGAAWSRGKNTKLPDDVLGAPIDTRAMTQIIKATTSKIGDKEMAKEINTLLSESVADVLKTRGWGSHAIGRKGIPGFEKDDIVRVLYDYKAGLNGWLTKMEASKDFGEALSRIDARNHSRLWEYSSQYVKDVLRNSDSIDRTTNNIKAVAFAWYLGANIKTATVNLTQNIIVGVPRLSMDVTGSVGLWISGAQKALVDRVTGSKHKGLTDEEARLVSELFDEKTISAALLEEQRGKLNHSKMSKGWGKFLDIMGAPMAEVEKFNRASLALAAFRAAREGRMKPHARKKYGVNGKNATYEQAKEFSQDVVRDAHFVYGKSNAPEMLRSSAIGRGLPAAAYTFRTFTHNMLSAWAWALSQGAEGKKFIAKSLLSTMALGGVASLPFFKTLQAIIQALFDDDDDWMEALREWLPKNNLMRDVVCYGVPSIAGVNLGGSLSIETPFTEPLKKGATWEDIATGTIGDIIGIPYDLIVQKPSKAIEAARAENWQRLAETVLPSAVSNAMQAFRLHTDGQTTVKGKPINNPGMTGARKITTGEAIGKFLGFQPVSSTKSYDAYYARTHAKDVRSSKIDELVILGLTAQDTKNLAKRQDMLLKLREWNEKMKSEGKMHMLIKMSDVERRMKSRRRENKINAKSLQEREIYEAVWS